jgi:hypothetical protein
VQDTPGSSSREDGKTYTYTIRPIVSGTLEFPPVEASYFDVGQQSYRTVRTQPIPVRANPAQDITGENVLVAATNTSTVILSSTLSDTAVAPIDISPVGAESVPPGPNATHVAVAVSAPAAVLLAWLAAVARRRMPDIARRRLRRNAGRACLGEIRSLGSSAAPHSADSWVALGRVLRQYLGRRLGRSDAGMTPDEARRALAVAGVPGHIADPLVGVLEKCVNAAFGGLPPSPSAWSDALRQAGAAVSSLEEFLRGAPPKGGRA